MNASGLRGAWRPLVVLALLAVAGFVLTRRIAPHPGQAQASTPSATAAALAQGGAPPPAPAPRLSVAFRLDPALTRGIYLGQRWVSPPEFHFAQQGARFVVEAKAQDVDADGTRLDVGGDWSTSDPEMVAISRHPGGVTLEMREAGESELTVRAGGASRTLRVSAERLPDAMRVRISQ
ncbi:MAG: hypothetical protein ACTHKZ_10960 [Lysobacteraceae bacterium]